MTDDYEGTTQRPDNARTGLSDEHLAELGYPDPCPRCGDDAVWPAGAAGLHRDGNRRECSECGYEWVEQ